MKTNQQTVLNGQTITYTLNRSRRRSIGLKIDHQGLSITIPQQAPLAQIETVLQEKADWITQKLKQWNNKQNLSLQWTADNTYPLFGEPWVISCGKLEEIVMARKTDTMVMHPSIRVLMPQQIEKFVMTWYHEQAITCFSVRIDCFAQKLHVAKPVFRLSHAKTSWGSCSSRGVVHLNWRLIQLPIHLIDYVIAHELCHLIEMNHSKAFWELVKRIYPQYLSARMELKKFF